MLCRVSSFTFDTSSVSLFLDVFSREALTPTRSLRSDFAETLVASRPEDAFIDLIASSILEQRYFQERSKLHSVSYLQLYLRYYSFPCQSFR